MAVRNDTDLKKKLSRSQQSHYPYQNHRMTYLGEVFEVEAVSSCTRLQLHGLCLGLVSRMLRLFLITHAGPEGVGVVFGGWWEAGTMLSGGRVRSNTDVAFL